MRDWESVGSSLARGLRLLCLSGMFEGINVGMVAVGVWQLSLSEVRSLSGVCGKSRVGRKWHLAVSALVPFVCDDVGFLGMTLSGRVSLMTDSHRSRNVYFSWRVSEALFLFAMVGSGECTLCTVCSCQLCSSTS